MEQSIKLTIGHGFVLKSLDDKRVPIIGSDPKRVHSEKLASIQTMTLADLHILASASIQTAFEINTEKCRKENGGKGFATEIYVLVDVDDVQDEAQMTRINITSENSWEACKALVGVAKGPVQVVYVFAVDRGTWGGRFLIRQYRAMFEYKVRV